MKGISLSNAALAPLAMLIAAAQADIYGGSYFTLNPGDPIATERLDPILAPGVVGSNHVHEFFGGSALQANWDFATAQKGSCNNMGPKIDHSNYWFPSLYFKGQDGHFTRVKPGLQIYYHFDTADNGPRTPFPPGFKMISGNAMLRSNDTATDFSTASLKWICHGAMNGNAPAKNPTNNADYYQEPYRGQFPTGFTACPGVDGFSGEIWFPFCWNGNDLDVSKPTDHVTFGTTTDSSGNPQPLRSQQGGKCPSSHPHPLPQLFMEFHHDISPFANKFTADENPWVLAQGDPTGYGMHADFINGWEDGMKDAISVNPSDPTKTKCFIGEDAPGASACFDMLDAQTTSKCTVAPALTEDVNGPMAALPGCNPIQSGPANAKVQSGCSGPQAGSGGAPASGSGSNSAPVATSSSTVATSSAPSGTQQKDAVQQPAAQNAAASPSSTTSTPSSGSSTGTGISVKDSKGNTETWTYQGCYSDLTPDRQIRTLGTWGTGSTSTDCANHCFSQSPSFKISGTESGTQCFCGNSVAAQSTKTNDGACNKPCAGSSETCGGDGVIALYSKDTLSKSSKREHKHRRAHIHESS